MPHLLVNRIPLYYEEHGHGKEHMVFIHGMGLSHVNWTGQVSYFRSIARVLTYDVRGHGRSGVSPAEQHPFTYFDELVEDLRQLMDHLYIDKAFLVGYSTGTAIALLFMLKYPERVWGAALTGAFPCVSNLYLYSKFSSGYVLGWMKQKTFLAKQVARSNGADENQIQLFFHEAKKVRQKEALLMIRAALCFDIHQKLADIRQPILMLYGGNERYMMAYRHQFLTSLPHVEICLIPKMNHACPTKGRDTFNSLIHQFMSEQLQKSVSTALQTDQYTGNSEEYPDNFPQRYFVRDTDEPNGGSRYQNQRPD